ncbi:unnamed protein product, partial [Musa banksii]
MSIPYLVGRMLRGFSLLLAIFALVLFHYTEKHDFNEADVTITNVLLLAALGLETIAVDKKHTGCRSILHLLRLKVWDSLYGVENTDVDDDLKTLIFKELKDKAHSAEGNVASYKRLRARRGECVLQKMGYTNLHWSFAERILLWHIATSICCQMEETSADASKAAIKPPMKVNSRHVKNDIVEGKKDLEANQSCSEKGKEGTGKIECKISKKISDYLMYLVVSQPSMLPAGIGKIKCQHTCAEVKRLLANKHQLHPRSARNS